MMVAKGLQLWHWPYHNTVLSQSEMTAAVALSRHQLLVVPTNNSCSSDVQVSLVQYVNTRCTHTSVFASFV